MVVPYWEVHSQGGVAACLRMQELQGELLDTSVGPDGEVFGKAFKPPGSK